MIHSIRVRLIIVLSITCLFLFYLLLGAYEKNNSYKLRVVSLEKDMEAISRSEYEAPQIIDKDYKRIIENRLSTHGIKRYRQAYDDILLPFTTYDVIVSSEYGSRLIWGRWERHYGIDLIPLYDLLVIAGISGEVIDKGYNNSYGIYVRIKNSKYIVTYAHLESTHLEVGDDVRQGSNIGFAGETGQITGLHLHFSIAENRNGVYYSVNPFRNSTYNKIVDVTKHRNMF